MILDYREHNKRVVTTNYPLNFRLSFQSTCCVEQFFFFFLISIGCASIRPRLFLNLQPFFLFYYFVISIVHLTLKTMKCPSKSFLSRCYLLSGDLDRALQVFNDYMNSMKPSFIELYTVSFVTTATSAICIYISWLLYWILALHITLLLEKPAFFFLTLCISRF